jgi:hypothetical protein
MKDKDLTPYINEGACNYLIVALDPLSFPLFLVAGLNITAPQGSPTQG